MPKGEAGQRGNNRGHFADAVDWRSSVVRKRFSPRFLAALAAFLVYSPSNAVAQLGGQDLFANRTPLTGLEVRATGSNAGGTKEFGEPNHASYVGGRSLWWTWTAPTSGSVTMDTRGSSFDSVLAVYTGNSVGELKWVASNDDWDGLKTSQVSFTATAGVAYQIAVDNVRSPSTGDVVLNLLAVPAGNERPEVSLEATPGMVWMGEEVVLTAKASDPDGQVVKVEFFNGAAIFNGAVKLGEVGTAPYTLTVSTLAVGAHPLVARATDDRGTTTTSATVTVRVRRAQPEVGYLFTTFAGPLSPPGMDGPGAAAQFDDPSGVAVDSAGNVYVADTENHSIRKITPGGEVATLAGLARESGSADGPGSAARFWNPSGVAVDSAGNVYVADTENETIRKITPGGAVTTLAGSAGKVGHANGPGSAARFDTPRGVAVDSAGHVYVADTDNRSIRKITPGGEVTTLAGSAGEWGNADGIGNAARFWSPYGVAVDGAGHVYVADTGNSAIRKITPGGAVTTLAGPAVWGSGHGSGSSAEVFRPYGVAVDGVGHVYVAGSRNQTIRKITPGGAVTTLAGAAWISGSTDGIGSAARFLNPSGVAVDSAGHLYVADTGNQNIRKITPGGAVTTLAGVARNSGSDDGPGSAARFHDPYGVALDSVGNVYVADTGNSTIRKITPGGVVTTLAGTAMRSGFDERPGSAALFWNPSGVAVDSAGHLYVADTGNHNIRTITPGGAVTTVAGAWYWSPSQNIGNFGSKDDTGIEAQFNSPSGVAVDSAGNVYVADSHNHNIRKITPGRVVRTLAGLAERSGSADGPGIKARFVYPRGVAVDGAGNLYVADTGNHTIRKITPGGEVTTLAGAARESGSADGIGSAARFHYPSGVAVDSEGNVYVANYGDHAIRKITPWGAVTTLVKWVGNLGAAQGGFPTGVAVDSSGNVYVAEQWNHSILVGRRTTVVDPAPSLAARREGGQILLSWPQTAFGYGLESSGELGAGAVWSPITTGIGTEGASFTHTHAPTQGIRFFRLRKP